MEKFKRARHNTSGQVSLTEIPGGKDKRNMKKVLMISLLIGVVSFGCRQEQVITQLEVGRGKLLGAGLTIEAVEHLKRAEQEEVNKVEPRALLLIAYSNALSTGMAKSLNLEDEYRRQRTERVTALGEYEMKKIFQILAERHRVQKDAIQILIDKGTPAVPFILDSLIKGRYKQIHTDFVEILHGIGSQGVEQLLKAAGDANTPASVKIQLIRIVGDIGAPTASAGLESLQKATADAGLKMEINTALYRLGNKAYQENIVAGLSDSNVIVRRAAAKSMVVLNEPPTTKMVAALEDTDDTVRMDIAKALQKHRDPGAVDNLVGILTNDSSLSTKQVALDALNIYVENGLADGLAGRLIALLTKPEVGHEVVHHEDRLRIVQLLKKPALLKQIEKADPYDNLPHKLDYYYRTKEENDMVKTALNELLLGID